MLTSKDYGIVLLPDDKTHAQAIALAKKYLKALAANGIMPPAHPNIPHLSLFQLHVGDDELPRLIHALQTRCRGTKPLKFYLDAQPRLVGQSIFWGAEDAKRVLTDFHRDIVDTAKPYRHPVNSFSQLSTAEKEQHADDIAQYGVYWGLPHNFEPHLTLVYHGGDGWQTAHFSSDTASPRALFTAKSLAIVELGPAGEAERINAIIKNFSDAASTPHPDNSIIETIPTPVPGQF